MENKKEYKTSEETRRKISESLKGREAWNKDNKLPQAPKDKIKATIAKNKEA